MNIIRRLCGFTLAGLVMATGAFAFPGPAEVSQLSAITFAKTDAGLEITIHVNGEFSNDVFRLTEPERLVMDLTPIEKISVAPQIDINNGGVLRVRTGQFKPQVARLAFDLESPNMGYKIQRTAEGLKVTFRKEGEAVPPAEPVVRFEVKPEPATVAKEEPKPAPPAAPKPVAATVATPVTAPAETSVEEDRTFFVLLGGGIGMFMNPSSNFYSTFSKYDKIGYTTETYKMKMNTPVSLSAGRYFEAWGVPAKAGLAFEYWNFKTDATYTFKVPHPLLSDTERTISDTRSFRTYYASVSAYALFHVYSRGGLMVLAGPEVGYATGKQKFLTEAAINDSAPYTEAELSVGALYFDEKTVSSLWGALNVGIEYSFSRSLAWVLNLKALYLSPEIKTLSNKLALSQFQAVIGAQYSF
jgi:hypothetical protein